MVGDHIQRVLEHIVAAAVDPELSTEEYRRVLEAVHQVTEGLLGLMGSDELLAYIETEIARQKTLQANS